MPELMKEVRQEELRYLKQLRLFDYDLPYDGAEIQASFIGLFNAMIKAHLKAGKMVYTMTPMEQGVGAQYSWVPVGMVYQLVPHGREPSAAAAVPFLPNIKQRYVRHIL